jgi:Xaa-Pro aminopeptidase
VTDRIGRLRDVVAALGAEAAIVTHPANRRYFSGFPDNDHAPDESSGVLLVTEREAILYTGATNLPWAESAKRGGVSVQSWTSPWPVFLGQQLQERGIHRAAIEDRALTVADHTAIQDTAAAVALLPVGNAFHLLRATKDDEEVATIRRAARITDRALAAATAGLQAGVSERELAWRIDRAMRDLGADSPGFPTIVAAGPHAARPHHDPTERPIEAGEPVIIDMGAMVDGYTADLTRTLCLGDPPPEFRARYNTVLAAETAALAGVRPGMRGKDADAIARDALASAGFGEQFVHGLGHGVGLNVHEYPSLGAKSEDVLQPGQVLTIEPGIYVEGWGGIRIEDLCVMTPAGLDVLSAAPK